MSAANPEFRVEGLSGLSRDARRFLRQQPQQARLAVVAALEAAATQAAALRVDTEVPAHLVPFLVDQDGDDAMIGVSEAASRLGVSRTTVYDWVERHWMLAWRGTRRGLVIPAEQIVGRGKVVAGIAPLVELIDDPELAWAFLAQPWSFDDAVARPIDRLKAGDVSSVLDAAPGFGMSMT